MARHEYDNTFSPGEWKQSVLMEEFAVLKPTWASDGIRVFFRDKKPNTRGIFRLVIFKDYPPGAPEKTALDGVMSAHDPAGETDDDKTYKNVRTKLQSEPWSALNDKQVKWLIGPPPD